MASNALISTSGGRLMPLVAILRHDFRTLCGSWLVRIWLATSAILTLLIAMVGWKTVETAPLVGSLLFPYLIFPWFLVVMVLGVNPISGSRVDALADGFLSRPITRHEYLLATWASRVVLVLGSYLLVMVPAVVIVTQAARSVKADGVTLYGVLGALIAVGLVLTLQVSLAFLMGVLLRKPLLAIVLLLFLWYPVNGFLGNFKLQSVSPLALNQALPTLLKQPWGTDKIDSGDLTDVQKGLADLFSVFPGATPPKPEPARGFFDQEGSKDFSLLRVVLSYGLSTLACVALAAAVFSRRDL